ncbi:MAG: twin-arginine translocase TatA/TatE family subunit [Bacteriovoracales bacterium]|nr:twin-arginine translocase TatA/TatE family subunit [Bacteriovoracales bacterium]
MFGLGVGELFLIGALGLILIGPKKIPELARSLGRGLREFQHAKDEMEKELHSIEEHPLRSETKEPSPNDSNGGKER